MSSVETGKWTRFIASLPRLFRRQGTSSEENKGRAVAEYNIEAQQPNTTTTEPQESSLIIKYWRKFKTYGGKIKERLSPPIIKYWRKYKAYGGKIKEGLDGQDMPKYAIAWGVTTGTAIAVMYQKDPKPMTGFMEVVAWLVPLGVTALFIGIVLRRSFPRFAFRATLVGYTFFTGSFFGLFSFFLRGRFSACIPVACWMFTIFVGLLPPFIHG